MSIISTLPTGRENGVSLETLMQAHGFASVRQLRKELQAERKSIGAICTYNGKYFRPASTDEYRKWRASRLRMAFTILKDIFILDRHFPELNAIEGQTTLAEIFDRADESQGSDEE